VPARRLAAATLLALTFAGAVPAHAALPLVAIQPLGPVDAALIREVTRSISATFAARVRVMPAGPLPAAAFYPPRRRWRGERILDHLDATRPAGAVKVLAVTSCDVSVTKGAHADWGVLGVAELGGPAAVVSVHRMGRAGAPVAQRLGRVATHELGHAMGLPHCRTPGCVMNDACGSIRTVDRSSGEFCPACRARLRGLLRDA